MKKKKFKKKMATSQILEIIFFTLFQLQKNFQNQYVS